MNKSSCILLMLRKKTKQNPLETLKTKELFITIENKGTNYNY